MFSFELGKAETKSCGVKETNSNQKNPGAKGAKSQKPTIKVDKISIDKLNAIVEHQKQSFYCYDTLTLALGMCENEDFMRLDKEQTKKIIEEGLSVMVLADGKVVAAHLNGLMCPGDAAKDIESLKDPKNPVEKIKYLKATANSKIDLFKKFGVNAIYDINVMSIHEDFQCPNVYFDAIKLDEKIAREAGFKLMKAGASGNVTEELLEKMGFEIASETQYSSVKDKNGKVMVPVKGDKASYKIMVKKI